MASEIDSIRDHLLMWLERYFENRRLMDRTISAVSKKDDCIVIEKTSGPSKYYFVFPSLDDIKSSLTDYVQPHQYIVALNTKDNLDVISTSWDSLHSVQHFGLMFINPFSKLDKKWVVFPSTHHLISDGKSIKKSLSVLFNNVDATTVKEVSKIISH